MRVRAKQGLLAAGLHHVAAQPLTLPRFTTVYVNRRDVISGLRCESEGFSSLLRPVASQ